MPPVMALEASAGRRYIAGAPMTGSPSKTSRIKTTIMMRIMQQYMYIMLNPHTKTRHYQLEEGRLGNKSWFTLGGKLLFKT